jgi:hypothetical protein
MNNTTKKYISICSLLLINALAVIGCNSEKLPPAPKASYETPNSSEAKKRRWIIEELNKNISPKGGISIEGSGGAEYCDILINASNEWDIKRIASAMYNNTTEYDALKHTNEARFRNVYVFRKDDTYKEYKFADFMISY